MRVYVYTIALFFSLGLKAQIAQKVNFCKEEFIEFAPCISNDGKRMIFQSNKDGSFKLYESLLNNENTWSHPVPLEFDQLEAGKVLLMGGPSLSADGNTLYFCAYLPDGLGDMDIYTSQWTGAKWSKPKNLGLPVNSGKYEGFPSISKDGKQLYFVRQVSSSSAKDKCFTIFVSNLYKSGNWSTPKELSAPLNNGCDKSPGMFNESNTLLFVSKKNETYDIYKSEQLKDNKWAEPVNMSFANSDAEEIFVTADERNEIIYYSTGGDILYQNIPYDLWLSKKVYVSGSFLDKDTKKSIKARVCVLDLSNNDTIYKSVASEKYLIDLSTEKKYQITAFDLEGRYVIYKEEITFVRPEKKTLTKDILLSPKTKEVVLKVSDAETNKGLKVEIKITNLDLNEEIVLKNVVGKDGKYAVNLREGNKYNVEISSVEGYAFVNTDIEVPLSQLSYTTVTRDSGGKDSSFIKKEIKDPKQEAVTEFVIKVKPLKSGTELVLKDIFFDSNSSDLHEDSYKELQRVVKLLNENPAIKIEISAHTDNVGADDFNMKLSERRAQEIYKYLISQNIKPEKLISKGYGKNRPVASNDTEEGRAKNRRVELKIIEAKKK